MPKSTNQKSNGKNGVRFAFFGTDDFSVLVLEELKKNSLLPDLIITSPDRPQGRGLSILPPAVKVWAMAMEIEYIQPENLNNAFENYLGQKDWSVFLVASYGKIIPHEILSIAKHGSLNIHPSLLPELRGASPIESAILYKNSTGATLMEMDEKMDHGPIVAQKQIEIENWPPKKPILESILAKEGAMLFSDNLTKWLAGEIKSRPQNHSKATFTYKIKKEQAEIDFNDVPEWNYRKIQAFCEWPRAYTYAEKNGKSVRVMITEADLQNGELLIEKVIPENKKEMDYEDFKRGGYKIPGYRS